MVSELYHNENKLRELNIYFRLDKSIENYQSPLTNSNAFAAVWTKCEILIH